MKKKILALLLAGVFAIPTNVKEVSALDYYEYDSDYANVYFQNSELNEIIENSPLLNEALTFLREQNLKNNRFLEAWAINVIEDDSFNDVDHEYYYPAEYIKNALSRFVYDGYSIYSNTLELYIADILSSKLYEKKYFTEIEELYDYDFNCNMYSLFDRCRESLLVEYFKHHKREYAKYPYDMRVENYQWISKLEMTENQGYYVYYDRYSFQNGVYSKDGDDAYCWLVRARDFFAKRKDVDPLCAEGWEISVKALASKSDDETIQSSLAQKVEDGELFVESDGLIYDSEDRLVNFKKINVDDPVALDRVDENGNTIYVKPLERIMDILGNNYDTCPVNTVGYGEGSDDYIYVEGFQINTKTNSLRVRYTIDTRYETRYTQNGNEAVEYGLIYGLSDYATKADMVIGSENADVYSFKGTENGKVYSPLNGDNYQTYAMTMPMIPQKDYYVSPIMVRAYTKMTDGSYVYSNVITYSSYSIAKVLYESSTDILPSGDKEFLYNNILRVCNPDYLEKVHITNYLNDYCYFRYGDKYKEFPWS